MNKEDLSQFLQFCSSPFHFLSYTKKLLDKLGFKELKEEDEWAELPTNGYVIRSNGAIIAFKYDSLNSMLITTTRYECIDRFFSNFFLTNLQQFDSSYVSSHQRPLRCTGYVFVKDNNNTKKILFDSGNENISVFTDTQDFDLGFPNYSSNLLPYLSEKLNVNEEDILDFHVSFFDQQNSEIIQDNNITCRSLNFLAPAYSNLQAFIQSEPKNQINVFCSFYNENELEFYRSPTIFDDFLTTFIDKVFCFDLKKNYLNNTFCICLESFKSKELENDSLKFEDIHLLQSKINFGKEKYVFDNSNWIHLSKQDVNYLLSGSTISDQLPVQMINIGVPVLSQDDIIQTCSYNALTKLFDILKNVYAEFH